MRTELAVPIVCKEGNTKYILQQGFPPVVSGQATVAVVTNANEGGRTEIIKLYAKLHQDELARGRIVALGSTDHASEILQHERDPLAKIGGEIFPSYPMVYESGEIDRVPYLTLTLSRQSGGLKENIEVDELSNGNILSLEQILNPSRKLTNEQRRRIRSIRKAPWQERFGFSLGILDPISVLPRNYGIIHNDVSPGQVLFLRTREGKTIVQIIDLGMHIDMTRLDEMESFLCHPTTVIYNSPRMLELYRQFAVREKTAAEIVALAKDLPHSLLDRDMHPSVRLLQALTFGDDGVTRIARRLIDRNHLLNEYAADTGISPSEFTGTTTLMDYDWPVLDEIVGCALEAHERHQTRLRQGKVLRTKQENIPRRFEEITHEAAEGNFDSLDQVMEELQKAKKHPVVRILSTGIEQGKKRAKRKSSWIAAGLLFLGSLGGLVYDNHRENVERAEQARIEFENSPRFLRDKANTTYRTTGKFDSQELRRFLVRAFEEQMVPPLERAFAYFRSAGGRNQILRTVADGRYQLGTNQTPDAGYFTRLVLLGHDLLGRDDFWNEYLQLIGDIRFEEEPFGYRIHRKTDPLREFVDRFGERADLEEIVSDSEQTLERLDQFIVDNRSRRLDDFQYLDSDPSATDVFNVAGFSSMISVESYWLLPLSERNQSIVNRHMETFGRFLVHQDEDGNFFVYDKAHMNSLNQWLPGIAPRIPDRYQGIITSSPLPNNGRATTSEVFYPQTTNLGLAISMYADWYHKTGRGGEIFYGLLERFRNLLETEDSLPELIGAPPDLRGTNNKGLAALFYGLSSNPEIVSPEFLDLVTYHALERANFGSEGLFADVRYEYTDRPTSTISGDLLFGRGLYYRILQLEEEK